MPTLFCSIPPLLRRTACGSPVGPEYQKACLHSWQSAGFDIVSLNHRSEIEALDRTDGIRFVEIEGRRPKICEIFAAASTDRDGLAGIANLDCMLIGGAAVRKEIAKISDGTLLLAERHNVSPDALAPTGLSCYGFDAFFFRPAILDAFEWDRNFHIGETWWDYWFPLAALKGGVKLRQLEDAVLLHLDHPKAWSQDEFLRNGARLSDEFGEIVPPWPVEDVNNRIGCFANACFKHIRDSAELVDFGDLPITERIIVRYFARAEKVAATATELETALGHQRALADDYKKKFATEADEAGRLWYLLGEERSKQKRLVGPPSKAVGEFLCTMARGAAPVADLLRMRRLVERVDRAGVDMQFRAEVKRGKN